MIRITETEFVLFAMCAEIAHNRRHEFCPGAAADLVAAKERATEIMAANPRTTMILRERAEYWRNSITDPAKKKDPRRPHLQIIKGEETNR